MISTTESLEIPVQSCAARLVCRQAAAGLKLKLTREGADYIDLALPGLFRNPSTYRLLLRQTGTGTVVEIDANMAGSGPLVRSQVGKTVMRLKFAIMDCADDARDRGFVPDVEEVPVSRASRPDQDEPQVPRWPVALSALCVLATGIARSMGVPFPLAAGVALACGFAVLAVVSFIQRIQ